jgi:hypothetical protein
MATALIPDQNVSLAIVNCESYEELCNGFDFKSYPAIRLFVSVNVIPLDGLRSADAALRFINGDCRTERGVNGILEDTVGLVPEAAPIVAEFLEAPESRKAAVENMKTVA